MNAHLQLSGAVASQNRAVIEVPLNKLKKSPRNARRVPHSEAAIEALAASIAAKGVLQAPVVEPEFDNDGEATGFWFVTIGEGRRLALARQAQGDRQVRARAGARGHRWRMVVPHRAAAE